MTLEEFWHFMNGYCIASTKRPTTEQWHIIRDTFATIKPLPSYSNISSPVEFERRYFNQEHL